MAYYNRGYAYSQLHQFQKTIDDYDRVIRFNPKYADVYFSCGYIYNQLGQFQNAIDRYSIASNWTQKMLILITTVGMLIVK